MSKKGRVQSVIQEFEIDSAVASQIVNRLSEHGLISEEYNGKTIAKVYLALTDVGLDESDATDAINNMQNMGVLFRERR